MGATLQPKQTTLERGEDLTVSPEPTGEKDPGNIDRWSVFVFLLWQPKPAIAIEELGIPRDEGEDPGAAPEKQQAVPFQDVGNSCVGVRRWPDQIGLHDDPFTVAEDTQFVAQQVYAVTDTSDELVYEVEGLAQDINLDLFMTLVDQPGTKMFRKFLELPIIHKFTGFLDKQHRSGRQIVLANVFIVDMISTRNIQFRGINTPTLS